MTLASSFIVATAPAEACDSCQIYQIAAAERMEAAELLMAAMRRRWRLSHIVWRFNFFRSVWCALPADPFGVFEGGMRHGSLRS